MVDFIKKINLPTNELRLETIQELLHNVRASRSTQNGSNWSELSQLLWTHIETELNKFDDQLLCATCFYTVLELTDGMDKEYYLAKISQLLNQELVSREDRNKGALKKTRPVDKSLQCHANEKNRRTLQVVSLMYGMVQSTFVTSTDKAVNELTMTLKLTIDLLIKMAYDYSRFTFIVFKTISSLKKVCGTELQDIVFSSSNLIRLLNLVNHNWENPITGVRDLNKSIFQILVSMFDENTKDMVLKEIDNFYWNKAKYLMLSEVIEQSKERVVTLICKNFWQEGLIDSLYKPGLVSAGADMYYAIIKNINSEGEWCDIFMNKVLNVLNGSSHKAIGNFSNYWCLATFKKFPDLSGVLIDELQKIEKSESQLYSSLCILKQANKLGIAVKHLNTSDSITEAMVLDRIEHCNPHIRMLQFEIIAIKQGKTLPTSLEFKLILKYLYNNVNSDCTVLRISMLGNIKCFFTHLHSSYCSHTKSRQNFEKDNLLNFYRSLQTFIIESLNLDGNYQRKVTTIKLCSILLSSLNEMPKKRQKQTANSEVGMITFLKQQECLILFEEKFLMKLFSLLKDPADDIRDNTVQLLLDHYSKSITPTLLDYLISDAQECVQSKFFYQISCGQSIFRLVTSLLLKEKFTDTIFKTADDVFCFAYSVLNTDYELKGDIVKSIEDGKQQHAYLGVMLEVLKVTKQNSYELKNLRNTIPHLLKFLEDISNQFAWEQDPATSSDFSKMSDMVKSIIASSGYNPLDENDLTKISGLQQIVLNCLWLNVKASCDLASYLIHFFRDEDVASCEKCLTIITHVLETSRHKGAIEAAGAALGRAIQHLTSLPDESALSRLPLSLLERKLNELVSFANTASVTRRGAGLSIMLHRIVSSDMKKGKPLFHHFMGTLLRVVAAQPPPLADSQRDEPSALYIHFLTRAAADSGLASDTMYYSAELAEVAFDNLTSTHWQIRNAALQLYGALIPKLIGQKKASGAGAETVASVACDELRTHSPKLWRHMLHCLQAIDHADTVQSHSNIMPILNVLANLAKRYNFDSDIKQQEKELLESLISLLGSPIFTVRRLTARCIFNIFDFEIIFENVIEREIVTENFLHGYLLLVGNYKEYMQSSDLKRFLELKDKFSSILDGGNHSYFSKREFDEQWSRVIDVNDIIKEAHGNRYAPGVFYWANSELKKHIHLCPWDDIPGILKILLKDNDYENYCHLILNKIKTSQDIPKQILLQIGEMFLASNKVESCVVWKILYQITTQIDLNDITDTASVYNYLQTSGVSYRNRYILPFLASTAAKLPEMHLLGISSIIFSLCDPDTSDVDMRHIASLANNEIAKIFPKIPDSVRISAIKCAVLLLQDEDEDVRMLNIQFYSNLKRRSNVMLHPYVCWTKILERNYLESLLDNPKAGIPIIYKELSGEVENYVKSEQTDEYNPFANDSKNIYFEVAVVKKQLQELKDDL